VKLRGVKLLGKFVFNDKPGVYKKIRHNRAKCIFGLPGVVGSECELDPDADVFVMERAEPVIPRAAHVVICDEDDNILKEMEDVHWDKVATLVRTDSLKFRLPRKRKPSYFGVTDVGIDMDSGRVFIEVREEPREEPKGD